METKASCYRTAVNFFFDIIQLMMRILCVYTALIIKFMINVEEMLNVVNVVRFMINGEEIIIFICSHL
jgi:hypothetical protein